MAATYFWTFCCKDCFFIGDVSMMNMMPHSCVKNSDQEDQSGDYFKKEKHNFFYKRTIKPVGTSASIVQHCSSPSFGKQNTASDSVLDVFNIISLHYICNINTLSSSKLSRTNNILTHAIMHTRNRSCI